MVAQSVLRDARLILLALLFVTSAARVGQAQQKPLPVPKAPPASEVIIIDLGKQDGAERASARDKIRKALDASEPLAAIADVDLDAALSGGVASGAVRRGRAAALSAKTAPCAEVETAARVASLELAAAQAAGSEVTADLRTAYAAAFRCAALASEATKALSLAQTLRSLGQSGPPDGIDESTWALYPELDGAANVTLAAVTIESSPPGADVWVDHSRRGVTPVTVHIRQGAHLVAAASGNGVASTTIDVTGWTHKTSLELAPSVGRWARVATMMADLRQGKSGADAIAIAKLMELTGVEHALVMLGGGTVEAWRAKGEGGARRLGQRRDGSQAVQLLERAASARAPDPNTELLRETAAERAARKAKKDKEKPAKWWVYAAVVGAAAVGAGIIIFGEAGEDRQRFEITLP